VSLDLTPERWRQFSALLDVLLDLPRDERAARLERECRGDSALRHAVQDLLQAEAPAEGFLEESALSRARALVETMADPPVDADPAARLPRAGPWQAVRVLGRGGMGVVFLAERTDGAFAQTTALKLLPLDLDSAEARTRFLREREILARLQHPHIAHLIDGGLTEDGRPFFAMEYVEGEAITAWCDARRASVEARLRLFLTVCEAVQYAHGRLIVHRDLKPDNVLVGAEGEVKLLDFGIAKLLEEGGEATLTGARALTPAYAAPEQFLGEPVTAATDVYQLGLVLYELLTGHRAHGEASESPLVVQRRVLEADPERPSRAVRRPTLREHAPRAGTLTSADPGPLRGTTGAALARKLAGDLDAIVLKALRREPGRRYESVEALHRDVADYLADRPIAARRGTRAYLAVKFGRRHRVGMVAGAAVLLSLVGGLLGVAVQSRVAAEERDRARAAQSRAAAVNDFLVRDLLQSARPEKALGRPLSVVEVLASASRSVDRAFPTQPEAEAEVRLALAGSYAALGHPGDARPHAVAAHRLLAQRYGEASAEAMRGQRLLAELALDEGHYDEARRQGEELRARQLALLGPRHPDTLATTATLGRALHALGKPAAAEALLRGALDGARSDPGQWRLAVELRGRLVDALSAQYKAVEAEAVCHEMLQIQRAHLGDEHPEVAGTLVLLAAALTKQLRHQEALVAGRQVVGLCERIYGEDHPATADALLALAVIYDQGFYRYDDALATLERARGIYHRTLGAEHPKTLRTLANTGIIHRLAGHIAAAEPIYREVLEVRRRTLGETHPDTILSRRNLNVLLFADGRAGEARAEAQRVIESYEAIVAAADADPERMEQYAEFLLSADPEDVQNPRRALALAERAVALTRRRAYLCLRVLGMALERTGQPQAAIAALRETLALPEAVRSWTTEDRLVALLREHAPPEELESFLLERVSRIRALRGDREPIAGKTLRSLALHYERQGRRDEAEKRLVEAVAQFRKTKPDRDWEVGRVKSELGGLLLARGAYARAEPLLVEGYEAVTGDVRTNKVVIAEARDRLARLYDAWGRPADAARWRKREPSPALRGRP
jgi:serine/threonine-protein kinase